MSNTTATLSNCEACNEAQCEGYRWGCGTAESLACDWLFLPKIFALHAGRVERILLDHKAQKTVASAFGRRSNISRQQSESTWTRISANQLAPVESDEKKKKE